MFAVERQTTVLYAWTSPFLAVCRCLGLNINTNTETVSLEQCQGEDPF